MDRLGGNKRWQEANEARAATKSNHRFGPGDPPEPWQFYNTRANLTPNRARPRTTRIRESQSPIEEEPMPRIARCDLGLYVMTNSDAKLGLRQAATRLERPLSDFREFRTFENSLVQKPAARDRPP